MAKDAAVIIRHMLDAIAHIEADTKGLDEAGFRADRRARQLVERNLEIVSEASRRLPDEIKARHAEIPWKDVAGIGNILRHDYHEISAPILWETCRHQLAPLKKALLEMVRTQGEKRKTRKSRSVKT